ncbi:MAG: TRAP transporter large permease subunit [Acidobacteria bacterium]|nr:TRAP transporter large permease subunit [Acidobacteriota bacterium]
MPSPSEQPAGLAERIENSFSICVLALMSALPLLEIVTRKWPGGGIPGSFPVIQHLTLWITLLGAALAARSDRLLALSTASFLPDRWRDRVHIFTSFLAVAITGSLVWASFDLVSVDYEFGDMVAWGIPVWVAECIMPLGFAAITGRLILRGASSVKGRILVALGLLIPLALGAIEFPEEAGLVLPASLVIVVGTALGLPIYCTLGGAAALLFWHEGTPVSAVPGETYRLSTSAMLPAIPLFTLGGYILAEGGSGKRLMRLFGAWMGWMPGGLAIVVTVVLAFFTPLTGASGITILSMGGLLLPMMVKAKYPHRTSVGLVTVSGSIGLLFPPSLPVILYAFYAEQPIEKMFVGGLLPGFVLVIAVAAWAAYQGWASGAAREPFQLREAVSALWAAKWEILLPAVVLGGILGGYTTLVEAAAVTVLYAFIVECFIFRDLSIFGDLPRIFVESATLVGGFMIILGVAMGFTNYLVIAEVPTQALDWVQAHVESKVVFLLALNVFLIAVGALMDIYSAILVIVPLITPMAAAYGIDPVHLGIIFLANMELGYLMPPMGENLFLSSYRFDEPLTQVYRSTLPYVVILLIVVLLITYVPALTLWLVEFTGV